MNLSKLEAKLLRGARKNPPSDGAPYAFEKRIMAKLASAPAVNVWSLWGKPLWRAAFSCIVVTALCGLWSFAPVKKTDAETLSQDLEGAVYASLNLHAEDAW